MYKNIWQIQQTLMINVLENVRLGRINPDTIKAIYKKPTANIILNWKKLKVIPLKSGITQGYPLSVLLFSTMLKVLSRAIWQEKEIKGIQKWKKEVKVSLIADDIIVYIRDTQNFSRKLLETKKFSDVVGYRISLQE